MTNHARCRGGSHSRTSGGIKKRLLAITRDKALSHVEIVLNPPDDSPTAQAQTARQPATSDAR